MQSSFLNISKSSLSFLSYVFLGKIFTLLFFIIISRKYGAEMSGIVSLILVQIEIVTTLSLLGLGMYAMKEIASYTANQIQSIKSLYYRLLKILFSSSLIASIILFLSSDLISQSLFNKPILGEYLRWLSVIVFPIVVFQLNTRFFQGMQKTNLFAFFFIAAVPFINVTVLLIFGSLTDAGIHFPVMSRFLSLLISSLISFIILMRLLNIKIPQNNLYQKDNKESTPNISSVLSSSNPFMLTQLLFVINNGIGIMILTSISSLSNVGIYSVAFKVSSYLMLIVNAVNSFVMPIFSKLWKENDISSIRKIYFKSTIFIFSLTSLLALFVIFFSEDILFYFGEDFIQSKNCLIILILTQVIVSYFGPLDSLLSMTDNQKIVRNNLFLSVAINSVLCFSLIPIFGIIGAAFAVFISRLFFVLLQIFYIYSKIGFFPRLRLFHD